MYSAGYSSQILMKLEFSGQIFEEYSNTKFHENPSIGSRVLPCGMMGGRADGHDKANSHISQFCKLTQKAENVIMNGQIYKNGTQAVGKRK
jgi:hypothetical protein